MASDTNVRRYQNVSGSIIGVIVHKPGGGFKGVPCYPGETVDLDHDEQVATANAPRDPRSNVLANGQMSVIMDDMVASERRPLKPTQGIETQDPANPATWEGAKTEAAIDGGTVEADAQKAADAFQAETAAAVSLSGDTAVGSFAPFEETGSPESLTLERGQEPVLSEGSIVPEAALRAERDQRLREEAEALSAGATIVEGRDVARGPMPAAPGQIAAAHPDNAPKGPRPAKAPAKA